MHTLQVYEKSPVAKMENEYFAKPLYIDDAERKQHESAINRLCEELSVQRPTIKSAYEAVLLDLKSRARIKDYLSIFVIRSIRDRYQQPKGAPSRRS